MSVPTFVVGTGRCGSTMLSDMLREHPRVLTLSEFFSIVTDAGRLPEAFASNPIDGRQFWAMLSTCSPRNNFALRRDVAAPELLYPCDDPNARFSTQTGVPAISITTLPHITDDHDRLFDLLCEQVRAWPRATPGEHYRRLFGWLAEHFGKRLWVERSGSSLMLVRQLLATFPEARFIHLVRDGRDAVLSMQGHLGFRLGFVMAVLEQYLGAAPLASADRAHRDRVPEELRVFLPERFDTEAFRAFRVPLPVLGDLWGRQLASGQGLLSALPADRMLTLRYEDLLAAPKQQLDALAAFLGADFVDTAWSTRCASTVRQPRSTWRDLPPDARRELTEACRPGFEQLRAAGVDYDL